MPDKLAGVYDVVSSAVQYAVAGLLAILWWDVRKVRSLRSLIVKEATDYTDVQMIEMGERFMSSDKHTDLCTINTLTLTQMLREEMAKSEERILKAIRKERVDRNADAGSS